MTKAKCVCDHFPEKSAELIANKIVIPTSHTEHGTHWFICSKCGQEWVISDGNEKMDYFIMTKKQCDDLVGGRLNVESFFHDRSQKELEKTFANVQKKGQS